MWAAFWTGSAWRRWACRSGHRLTAHLQSGIGLLRRADTRHLPPPNPCIRLFRSFSLRPAPQSGGESACACGLWLDTDGDCGSAYGSLRCNRVSACCAAPTPDWLFTASAQCSVKPVPQRLCRASGTLSAVNRLVLHSHSLQAQCSRCARGCRWREPTRSPPLCSSHAKRFTAL